MACPGDTPLHLAIQSFKGDKYPIKIILYNDNCGINVRNSEGETPLLLAVQNESCTADLIMVLLINGADVQATSPRDGNTALHRVAMRNTATNDVLKWHKVASVLLKNLVKNGSDANARNLEGCIPLHLVAETESMTYGLMLVWLLKPKSDVNARNWKGDTPLHVCIRNKKVSSAFKRAFLECVGDVNLLVNVVNSKGESPLHLAVRRGECDLEFIKNFLDLGADVSIRDATGENVYQAFCRAIMDEDSTRDSNNPGRRDILMSQTLLRGNLKQTISSSLHVACLFHNVDSVHNLLRMGADVNPVDPFDRAPLYYAVLIRRSVKNYDNQCSTVGLMLDYGADVNQLFIPLERYSFLEIVLSRNFTRGIVRRNVEYTYNSSNLFLDLRDIFIQHAAKRLALEEKQVERGLDVQLLNERNRQILIEDPFDYVDKSGYKDWLSRCFEELQAMSVTKIGKSVVTFFDLLVASANKAAIYSKNKTLIEAFQAGKNMFLMYRGMLEAQIDKAIERRKLIDRAAVCLSDILQFADPSDEFYEITLSYCSNQDLMTLIG